MGLCRAEGAIFNIFAWKRWEEGTVLVPLLAAEPPEKMHGMYEFLPVLISGSFLS